MILHKTVGFSFQHLNDASKNFIKTIFVY